MKFLDGYKEHTYALLRIVAGLLFMAHGVQKLFNFPAAFDYPLNPVLYAAAAIELIGGAAIALGLFTRPAAFIASGMSAAAYWMAHGSSGLYPITNGGEIVALYCFIFLFIAARGAGMWSVDGKMSEG
ncbi:DoxX family protein [Sphingorhabdus sp. YGSMI21]|uniref:DoxX family protein n=1 Tax=Sphingorhabdus sp. YGSMI21 TaxID=2077182 RepID=UPI000C1E52D0|nr:DoxX family protein [Sphingorhabdus sp. YGSMI21]ATW04087.1 LuxR family transcriptional regulator [Sphingorhabdus sp. YGSMI21]